MGTGVVCCAFVTWISRRMGIVDEEVMPSRGGLGFLLYLPWLLKQIVLANLDVARLVWDPRLPISPRLVQVPYETRTAMGTVTYANSITLTPGTVTISAREGKFLVHALTEGSEQRLRTGEMQRRIQRLEGAGP